MELQTRYKTKVIKKMKKLETELLSEGISRHQAHIKIGERFGLTRASIYRLLTPHILEKDRKRSREYQRNYARRPEIIKRHRNWNRKYMRLCNHIDDLLEEIFGLHFPFSIEKASSEITLKTGIKIKPDTILIRLKKKYEKYGISPVLDAKEEEYMLNPRYFRELRKQ
jgi:hypothetical protein